MKMNKSTLSMHELHEVLPNLNPSELILDVRTREEFLEGHVPGAVNISHDEIALRVAELFKYSKIFIYCRSGRRAQITQAELENRGISNIFCVAVGGMEDWIQAGYKTNK